MDCPPDVFFTEAAFEQYALQPTFVELLEKHAPKPANDAILGRRGSSHASTQPQLSHLASLVCSKGGFYPHFSCLTHDQQRKYLELESKYSLHSFQGHHSSQELHELREYRQYQQQVSNEQREFQRFAEGLAKRNTDDYAYLHPLAHAYIKGLMKQWQHEIKALPQNYALYQTIGMSVEPVVPSDPVLKHVGSLLSLGEAPMMAMPGFNPHDPPTLHHEVSVKDGAADKLTDRDPMELICEDENARKLAAKYRASIVISYAALEVILNTHPPPFEQQWEIPITVSQNTQGDSKSSTNLIFIDKPLKQKVIFPHEASVAFHKIILQQFLNSNPNKPPVEVDSKDEGVDMYLQAGVEFDGSQDPEDDISKASALVDLETFGSGLTFPLPKKINQCTDTLQEGSGLEKTFASEVLTQNVKIIKDGDSETMNRTSQDQSESSNNCDGAHVPGSSRQPQQEIQETIGAKPVNYVIQESMLIPDSPQSPEPIDTTPQMDIVQDSPQSFDVKSTTCSSQLPATVCQKNDDVQGSPQSPDAKSTEGSSQLPVTVCQKTDDLQDSPQSPDAKSSTRSPQFAASMYQKNDDVRDSPQSPDAKSNEGSSQLHTNVLQKNDGVQDSPQSPNAELTISVHGEVVQELCPKPLESQVEKLAIEAQKNEISANNISSVKEKHNELNMSAMSSASENELMIASADDARTTGEENTPKRVEEMSASESQDMSHVQTRRSKRLKVCDNSDHSGEDNDGGTTATRRRSARLRKVVDGVPSHSPAKKVKRTNNETPIKEKDVCESVEDEKVKTSAFEKMDSASKIPSISGNKGTTALGLDSTNQNNDASKTNLEPKVLKNCTTDSQSTSYGESAQSVKETSKITNLASDKSRSKVKDQQKKKPGGVSSTIDTIMKLQEKLHTRRQQKANEAPRPSEGTSFAESQLQNPTGVKPENPADYICPKHGNLSYNLWKLGKLSVLIRTRDDGMTKQTDGQNSQSIPVTVIPKMEYQTHFGFEQMALSELCQIWANLFIRPGSKVISGRIDALTSHLLKLEWLDLSNPLWMQCPFNPARSMKMVHTICDKLQGLPEGKYLLSHNQGDTHASVHLALEDHSKKKVTYDLHKAHATWPLQTSVPAVLSWLPLDPKMPLIRHVKQKLIPLTFPPRSPGMKLHTGQGMSKKKKKIKKKNNMQASR